MSDRNFHSPEMIRVPPDRRIRLAGMVVLVTGLLLAVLIFMAAQPDQDPLGGDGRTKRDTLELEKMGGQSYVLSNDLNIWLASLWHGRRLAYMISIFSVAVFFSCRRFANSWEPISRM